SRSALVARLQPGGHVDRGRRRRAARVAAARRPQPAPPVGHVDGPLLIRVRIPAEAAGLRLDRFLAGLDEVASRAAAERLLDAGEVLVDGAARSKSYRLEAGQEIELEPPVAAPLVGETRDLRIA